jgi:hypothetical protein
MLAVPAEACQLSWQPGSSCAGAGGVVRYLITLEIGYRQQGSQVDRQKGSIYSYYYCCYYYYHYYYYTAVNITTSCYYYRTTAVKETYG